MNVDNIHEGRGNNWLRPSILQKGLGIVLVPLVLQVVLFVQFYTLLGKTDELTRREAHQSMIVEELQKLTELFTMGWGSVIQQTLDGNQVGTIDPEIYKQRFTEGMNHLKSWATSPALRQVLERTDQLSARQYALLKEFQAQTEPSESSMMVFAKYRKMKEVLRPYMRQAKLIDEALISERANLNRTQAEAQAHRDMIKNAIVIGVILEIILTLFLVVFLFKNISDRLKMLVRHARLLPEAQPLPGQVSGSDELAYLDQVLHQASAELQKAAEYRKAVMETMSHDLRSPVQSALITAELLERSQQQAEPSPETEKNSRHIDSLKRNLSRVVGLVEDHLTIDKLESGTASLEVTSFNLRKAVDEAVDALQAQANLKSIELVNKAESILVEADRGRIIQVLANFLGNAIKYSPRSAPIFISTQNLGHSVKVMVLDDGPGMDAEAQAMVYERFHQNVADGKSRQGYGLGLAICKLLIQHHNGKVGVTSAPGKGSTFWFILPLEYEGE